MGIAVGEEAALQHLVGGGTDAPAWSVPVQGRLLNFGEVIFGIAIQGNSADRYQPVLAISARTRDISAYSRATRPWLHRPCLQFRGVKKGPI
jgi:hypothetical protein